MTRARNADDFLTEFRSIRREYAAIFGPQIERLHRQYAEESPPFLPGTAVRSKPHQELKEAIQVSLEAHARAYVVNAMLAALNWRLDAGPSVGLPNLLPEAPIESSDSGRTRFLDYLGFERDGRPLLIVETKRPRHRLPQLRDPALSNEGLPEVVSRGLAGEELTGKWNEWLCDVSDYARSARDRTGTVPRRMCITNGSWLILFLDVQGILVQPGTADSSSILVYRDETEIEKRYRELFECLEHQQVLGEVPPLDPAEIGFHVTPAEIERVMHAVRVLYVEQPGIYDVVPAIKIAPILLLRSRVGVWLRVERATRGSEYFLPPKYEDLGRHLDAVDKAATQLMQEVEARLGAQLSATGLVDHYGDPEAFEAMRGVSDLGNDHYIVVTGNCHALPSPGTNRPRVSIPRVVGK